MEICDFAYYRPQSLQEASELVARLGPEARFLAGGTELLADLKQQRDQTPHVISLADVPGLDAIRVEQGDLVIGATARLQQVADSPLVQAHFAPLTETIERMAALQIRHRATIGGNFCGAVPSADTPPICIAAGATVTVGNGQGDRTMPAEAFFRGVRETALEPGELLISITIPVQPDASGARYERFQLRKATALAVVGVAARLVLDGEQIAGARVALGAVAPVPLLASETSEWLVGKPADEPTFTEAGRRAAAEAKPISDLRASAEYRRELVDRLTVRALAEAAKRARQ